MTYTKEDAKSEIFEAVERFRQYEPTLSDVKEAQIEQNYIRPLLRCLNWNVDNKGLSPSQYEVLIQYTDKKGKCPDYLLQLEGQHLLLMDAKQVKLDMHDPRWLNQVYSYAYSTQNNSSSRKVDFAVLTDFQEFVLLDCTLKIDKPEAINNLRILDWKYDDYVTQFDTLWELFEKENMRKAAASRFSEKPIGLWSRRLSPQKVKANRIMPDQAFLKDMDNDKDGWRVLLAKDMKKHNPQASGELITAACQLLIDRLLFIKALSDRELEDDYLAKLENIVEKSGLAENETTWFAACKETFEILNKTYNGSIFEERPELENVSVSNKVIHSIVKQLQPDYSPYHFASMPVEILGTIYERFLGRVVRTTEQRVKIEEKPEVRKAGGVYYTPQYIVEYIVKETVDKLLEKCKTPADVAKLKILDPACGSGSFLLGAYDSLIRWHEKWFADKKKVSKREGKAAYYDEDGRVRLTAKLKREILLNNIFGVDIDPQAVEVTRFSLSLKALDGTRQNELVEERDFFKQSVLPDLSGNIKCGNSLIGTDYFDGQLSIDAEELQRVRPFDWGTQFKEIFKNTKFDIVIGNPPYLKIEYITESNRDYFFRAYHSCIKRYDAYGLFVERALKLLNPKGLFGMIIPSTFLNNLSFCELRRILIESVFIQRIVNLGGKIFDGVTNDTLMLIFTMYKSYNAKTEVFDVTDYGTGLSSVKMVGEKNLASVSPPNYVFELRMSDLADGVLAKMNQNSLPLKNICSLFQGFVTGGNDAYIIDEKDITAKSLERAVCKRAIFGNEISRYGVTNVNSYVIYLTKETKLCDFPNIEKHLTPYKSRLQNKREVKLGRQPWYSLHWARTQMNFERSPKILVQAIRNLSLKRRIIAALDTDKLFADHTLTIIYTEQSNYDLRYILGILNSNLINFIFQKKYVDINIKGVYLADIPVRQINLSSPADKAHYEKIVSLVESVLNLHRIKDKKMVKSEKDICQQQINVFDRQIDYLVYDLYGLTDIEIKNIEES